MKRFIIILVTSAVLAIVVSASAGTNPVAVVYPLSASPAAVAKTTTVTDVVTVTNTVVITVTNTPAVKKASKKAKVAVVKKKAAPKDKQSYAGVHGGMTSLGDIETPSAGFGAQAGMNVTKSISAEISVTSFGDESSDVQDPSMSMDVLTVAGTVYLKSKKDFGGFRPYVGVGLSYNTLSIDSIGVEAFANVVDLRGLVLDGGINFEVDPAIGYHGVIGASYQAKHFEFFVDYRYTFLSVDVEMSSSIRAYGRDGGVAYRSNNFENLTEDFNFGLVRAGVNYRF